VFSFQVVLAEKVICSGNACIFVCSISVNVRVFGELARSLVCAVMIKTRTVGMASVCFRVIAVALMSFTMVGFAQSYQENDIMYASKFDSWKISDEHSKVNVSVNLRTAVRMVDKRFVSVTLDSNLVDIHWAHFNFRYDVSQSYYLPFLRYGSNFCFTSRSVCLDSQKCRGHICEVQTITRNVGQCPT